MPTNNENVEVTRKLRIFPLSGNKERSLDVIVPEVTRAVESGCTRYVEPFLGSGSLFLNIPIEGLSTFILGEKSEDIVNIWNLFRHINFGQFSAMLEAVRNEFGDIREDESYRVLRDNVNNAEESDAEFKAFKTWLLFGSCLSSKPRWNPKHEFNQSSGHRDFSRRCDRQWFDSITTRLNIASIFRSDWNVLAPMLEDETTVVFLDPPYLARVQSSMGDWNEANTVELLNACENARAKIILTDVETEVHRSLLSVKWKKTEIRQMKSSGPNRLEESTGMVECMWTNY